MSRPTPAAIERQLGILGAQIEILRAQEEDLQRHIDALQHSKASVHASREALENEEVEVTAAKYPINWLPVELLIVVFTLYTGNPFTLTYVNHKWRDIAVSIPAIWTRISTVHADSELTWISMERARNLPLELTLTDEHTDLRILRELDPGQLRSATIWCHRYVQIAVLFSHFREAGYPELERLEISCTEAIASGDLNFVAQVAEAEHLGEPQYYPKLASFTIKGLPPLLVTSRLFANLTVLSLISPTRHQNFQLSVQGLIKILSWTPRLKELSLEDASLSVISSANIAVVSLPRLQTLNWDTPSTDAVMALFCHLRVPALAHLELVVYPASRLPYIQPPSVPVPSVSALESVTSLFLHSTSEDTITHVSRKFLFPALATFELTNTKHGTWLTLPKMDSLFRDPRLLNLTDMSLTAYKLENMSATLGYLPRLMSLSLDSCSGTSGVLEAMRVRCPHLESLTFWACADLDGKELVSAIRSRNTGGDVDKAAGGRRIRALPSKLKGQADVVRLAKVVFTRVEDCPGVSIDDLEELMQMDVAQF